MLHVELILGTESFVVLDHMIEVWLLILVSLDISAIIAVDKEVTLALTKQHGLVVYLFFEVMT